MWRRNQGLSGHSQESGTNTQAGPQEGCNGLTRNETLSILIPPSHHPSCHYRPIPSRDAHEPLPPVNFGQVTSRHVYTCSPEPGVTKEHARQEGKRAILCCVGSGIREKLQPWPLSARWHRRAEARPLLSRRPPQGWPGGA